MNGEYTMKTIGKISMAALSLLCVACSQKDNYPGATRIEWTDFPEERTLSGSEIHFSDEGLKPVSMQMYDSLLITINPWEERLFHVYDVRTKKKINSCISLGQGPEEMIQPVFVGDADSVRIFDMAASRYCVYSVDSFMLKSQPKPTVESRLSEPAFGEMGILDNGCICAAYNPDFLFHKYDKEWRKVGELGTYPESGISFTESERLEAYRFAFVTNHHDRIAVCYNWTDLIEIYDEDGNPVSRLFGPEHFVSRFKEMRDGDILSATPVKGIYRDAFVSPKWVGDFLYVLFKNESEGEKGYDNLSEKILVFDREGTPMQILSLDKGIFTFTVDEKGKKLYGISNRPDYHIVEFLL